MRNKLERELLRTKIKINGNRKAQLFQVYNSFLALKSTFDNVMQSHFLKNSINQLKFTKFSGCKSAM